MVGLITLKLLNSLTSIDTLVCLGGLDVTHPTVVREVSVRFPAQAWIFKYAFLFCCYYGFYGFCSKHIICMTLFSSFCNFISFSILA